MARAPALPAQGLHHHEPRYFNFPYFCTTCGLEKLELVDQKWLERLERNLSALLRRPLVVVGGNNPSGSRLLSIWSKEV